jgi:hypothetical protein
MKSFERIKIEHWRIKKDGEKVKWKRGDGGDVHGNFVLHVSYISRGQSLRFIEHLKFQCKQMEY